MGNFCGRSISSCIVIDPPLDRHAQVPDNTWRFLTIACAITWLLALPTVLAWLDRREPSAWAIAGAGLSAFGPLIAVFLVTTRAELQDVFSRWRTPLRWALVALVAPAVIHIMARLLFASLGGEPQNWLFLPPNAEAIAALIVFPLGEEFGWRGYCYPKMASRFGLVKGSLVVGLLWGFWHLAYSVSAEKAAIDYFEFGLGMIELPLYSLLIAWVMERSNRSLAVALLFHAGGHLDHLERDPGATPLLHLCHLIVLAIVAALAAQSLRRRERAEAVESRGLSRRTLRCD